MTLSLEAPMCVDTATQYQGQTVPTTRPKLAPPAEVALLWLYTAVEEF